MIKKKRYWALSLFIIFLLSSFAFNQSLRDTLSRRKAIRQTQKRLLELSEESEKMRTKLVLLEKNPATTEQLIRQELGYLRPGEKEVRFISKHQ